MLMTIPAALDVVLAMPFLEKELCMTGMLKAPERGGWGLIVQCATGTRKQAESS